MNIKNIIIAILLIFSISISAQEELNVYLEVAAENNPSLKASFNEYQASLQVIPQVGVLPDPQLAFGYFISPIETRFGPQRAKISLSQMLPWFGTIDARENIAVQNAKVKYEAFEELKSNLYFEIKAAYYDLYFNEKSIGATLSNILILETFRNLAMIKIESGSASAVDGLRAEMELADLENKLALLKDNGNVLRVKFNKLLNTSDDSQINLPEILWNNDLTMEKSAILDSLSLNNHQVLGLSYAFESFQGKEGLARKAGLPDLSIGLDYFVIGASDNTSLDPDINGRDAFVFPRIGITIPLYRKKYTAMVQEAVFMQQATANKKVAKVKALESIFEKAYSEYMDADRRIKLFHTQLQIVDNAVKILESEYATSGKDFEEILRMERRWLRYAVELEKARSDKQAAIAFIDYIIGK